MDSIQQLWFTCRTYENGNHVECLRPGRQWTGSLTSADKHSFYDLGHHRCQWNGAIASDLSPDLYSEIMFASFHADGTPSRWRDNWSVMVLAQMLFPWEILLECCLDHSTYWRLSVCMVNTLIPALYTQQKQRYEFHTKIGMISLFTLGIPKMVWKSYQKRYGHHTTR